MESVAEDLAKKTRAYWLLSSVWNDRVKGTIPTGKALEACTTLMERTNCERPLSKRVWELRDELVEGTGRIAHNNSKILSMVRRAQ